MCTAWKKHSNLSLRLLLKNKNFIGMCQQHIFWPSGQPIPRIKYTAEEISTWKTIYRALTKLYDKYACSEFKNNWKELETLAGYR